MTTVLEGLLAIDEFATQVKRRPRTIARWIRRGMPVTRIGQQPYVDPVKARKWLEDGGATPSHLKPVTRRRRAA